MEKFSAKLIGSSGPIIANAGQEIKVWAEFLNTGANAWDSNVRLGTEVPRDRTSIFFANDWFAASRPGIVKENIFPGKAYRFEFTIKIADSFVGDYKENFNLVREHITWFTSPESRWQLCIQAKMPDIFTEIKRITDIHKTDAIEDLGEIGEII